MPYTIRERCEKCGKPYIYVGDWPEGGFTAGFEPYCTCGKKENNLLIAKFGWICPKCGQSVNPYLDVCPCSFKYDVTC